MAERPSPIRIARLRRLRLLRAQRQWHAVRQESERLHNTCAELEQQCARERTASARCLQQAEAGAARYALALRKAAAHNREADMLAGRRQAASTQLAALAPRLRAARLALEKAKQLLEASPRV